MDHLISAILEDLVIIYKKMTTCFVRHNYERVDKGTRGFRIKRTTSVDHQNDRIIKIGQSTKKTNKIYEI